MDTQANTLQIRSNELDLSDSASWDRKSFWHCESGAIEGDRHSEKESPTGGRVMLLGKYAEYLLRGQFIEVPV